MVINMKTTMPGRGSAVPGKGFFRVSGEGRSGLFEKELDTYHCVAAGDCAGVRPALEELIREKAAKGGLDMDSVREAGYRAAEIINIAARYAAQNGPDENLCLRLADECVNEIDALTSREEIYSVLVEKTVSLTRLVSQAKQSSIYPYIVRRAIGYISSNLSRNITVIETAQACGVSPDYLSYCFRRATGERMTAYIRSQRMQLARDILGRHIRCSEAAKRLSFCSESYFVKCFKDEFGITPKKWQSSV